MTGQDQNAFSLKNGAVIDGPFGSALWEMLDQLREGRPQLFASLVAIVQGRADGVPPDHISALQEDFFLRADGTAVAPIRDVLLSSYRESADGPVLVNPFRFESESHVQQFRSAEADRRRRLQALVERDEGDAPTGGRGGR